MGLPDAVDLQIREIGSSIYEEALDLDCWKMQEVKYISPGNYVNIGREERIYLGQEWDNSGRNFIFSKEIELPQDFRGREVFLELEIGGESAVYIDGRLDRGLNENIILLSTQAKAHYQLKIEATHNIHQAVRHYRLTGKEYPRHYFKTARLLLKNKAVEEYYYLLKTVKETLDSYRNDNSYRKNLSDRIEEADPGVEVFILEQAVRLSLREVNFYTEQREEYLNSIKRAGRVLEEKLEQIKRVYSSGRLTFIGHSHLDLAFKWPIKETIRKLKRTLSTTINLMDRFSKFYFVQSQPQLYSYLKEYYPELYQKVKTKVVSGRIQPVGAMWVEADTNLPSGESLVRQLFYGKKFYREEFGLESEICWLPDCFGFSGSLPQILRKAGIKYFLTTKLTWNDTNQYPHNILSWQGIDGTKINAYLLNRGYGGEIKPAEMRSTWQQFKDKHNQQNLLYLYGYGDGGGGLTAEMQQTLSAVSKIPFLPEVEIKGIYQHLAEIFEQQDQLPVWRGELYFEKHRGVYTSQAVLKKNNRKNELLLKEAEIFAVLAELWGAEADYQESLEQSWLLLLQNQFHDILPGSCIQQVVTDALADHQQIEETASQVREEALVYLSQRIAFGREDKSNPIIVFNSLSWQRDGLVQLRIGENRSTTEKIRAVKDKLGNILPVQQQGELLCFTARDVPSFGYQVYLPLNEQIAAQVQKKGQRQEICLENRFFKLIFNDQGHLVSIYDQKAKREIIPAGQQANVFEIFIDKSTYFDSWDLNIREDNKYVIDQVEEIKTGEQGPVYQSLTIKKTFHQSTIKQEVIIYQELPRIDFMTEIDWQERQMLLKVSFPVDLMAERANYDIAFGNLARPVHNNTSWDKAKSEVPAHKWADISEYGYGVSLLNDSKYGYDIKDNRMRLTLLKGGVYPDPEADLGLHSFTYALYPHQGDFKRGGTVQAGYELNQPLLGRWLNGRDNKQGSLLSSFKDRTDNHSFIQSDRENVIIETLKKAEEQSGYILRCYEVYGERTNCTITVKLKLSAVEECDLLERPLTGEREIPSGEIRKEEIMVQQGCFSFEIKPYEIKTFLLKTKTP